MVSEYCGVHVEVKTEQNRNGEHNQTKNKNKRENRLLAVGAVQGDQCSFGRRTLAEPNKFQHDYHTRLVQ